MFSLSKDGKEALFLALLILGIVGGYMWLGFAFFGLGDFSNKFMTALRSKGELQLTLEDCYLQFKFVILPFLLVSIWLFFVRRMLKRFCMKLA